MAETDVGDELTVNVWTDDIVKDDIVKGDNVKYDSAKENSVKENSVKDDNVNDDSTLHWAVVRSDNKKPVFAMSATFKQT